MRAGKTLLNVPPHALALPPVRVPGEDALVAVLSSEGKLLVFPVRDVPQMPRGKGNKLYDIPGKKVAAREEFVAGLAVVAPRGSLEVWTAEKKRVLGWADLKEYRGERAHRGALLPRGWPRTGIERLEALAPPQS